MVISCHCLFVGSNLKPKGFKSKCWFVLRNIVTCVDPCLKCSCWFGGQLFEITGKKKQPTSQHGKHRSCCDAHSDFQWVPQQPTNLRSIKHPHIIRAFDYFETSVSSILVPFRKMNAEFLKKVFPQNHVRCVWLTCFLWFGMGWDVSSTWWGVILAVFGILFFWTNLWDEGERIWSGWDDVWWCRRKSLGSTSFTWTCWNIEVESIETFEWCIYIYIFVCTYIQYMIYI